MASVELNARLIKRIDVSPGLAIFRVAPHDGDLAPFKPGQYTTIALPGSHKRDDLADGEETPPDPDKLIKRAYSISSSSKEGEYIEFYITLIYSGALTPRLFAMKEGDSLYLAPKNKGVFTLDSAPEHVNLIMLATGTGVAPYMSMIRSVFFCGDERKFALVHGARHSWDLGYRAELESLQNDCHEFSYIPVISRPDEEKSGWAGDVGYVGNVWDNERIAKEWGFAPTPDDTHIYICGNPEMAEGMVAHLIGQGYTEHSKKVPGQIHIERFW